MKTFGPITIALVALFVSMALNVEAHNGRLAKDGCHWDRTIEEPERHWHLEGTHDRAGHCSKDEHGNTIYHPAMMEISQDEFLSLVKARDDAAAELEITRQQLSKQIKENNQTNRDLRQAYRALTAARQSEQQANQIAAEAREDAAAAEARAAGIGVAVIPKCVRAVNDMLEATWFSLGADKKRLETNCLNQ